MVTFRDVARNIERNAVNTALSSIPVEFALSQGLDRVGSPMNLLSPNHDLDAPVIGPDGVALVLLRANTVSIGEGRLAP